MPFAKEFPLLSTKAGRKVCARTNIYEVTIWFIGYAARQLDPLLEETSTMVHFSKACHVPVEIKAK